MFSSCALDAYLLTYLRHLYCAAYAYQKIELTPRSKSVCFPVSVHRLKKNVFSWRNESVECSHFRSVSRLFLCSRSSNRESPVCLCFRQHLHNELSPVTADVLIASVGVCAGACSTVSVLTKKGSFTLLSISIKCSIYKTVLKAIFYDH